MRITKPASLLAACAGGPVAFGLVAAGFAAIGFAAGSLFAKRRKRGRLVDFIDRSEKHSDDAAAFQPFARFAGDTDGAPGAFDPDLLLEYAYHDSPMVPSKPAGGVLQALPIALICLEDASSRMAASAPAPARRLFRSSRPQAEFDVERAESLLQLALDAYSQPPAGQGYQTQDVEGLPVVTFFDKEIMKAIYTGVLLVRLEGASNLRPASGKGSVSPYAEVYVTSGSFRTRADKNATNPVWNFKQALLVRNPGWDALTVDVYDNNRTKDKLGTAVLGLGEMVDSNGREFRFRLPLRGPAGESASVNLSCRYLEFSTFDPDEIQELKPPGPPPVKGKELTSSGSMMRPEKVAGMRPAAFVENQATDTQVWLYSEPKERKLVFSFRGTEVTHIKDILTDANLAPCGFKPIHAADGKPPKEKGNVSVHRGFMGAYDSVRRKLSSLLHAITMSAGTSDPWDVLVTGHSLGGALATLSAYELASYKEHAGSIRSVTLYTYGCPRVGNATFAADFNKVLQDAWRVTNRLDVVPSVPPSGSMWKFTHVGNPVRLREDGIFYKGTENPQNPQDDLDKDISWLASLFSWKGTAEHAGEYYQQMLHQGKKLLLAKGKDKQQQQGIAIRATSGVAAVA
ncbi:hypothetical protein PLESTF_000759200 [Pleodorina starrii]|nr:hypothetical protein PLESTM_001337900 [Pleodorina starrii]GLC68921.1 hypothetical protein PLESTF_000759200 [Pleodorina starrii]